MHYVLIRHMSIEHWYDVKTVENNFLAAVNSFFLLFFVKTVVCVCVCVCVWGGGVGI